MDKETRAKVLRKITTERDLRNQMAYACKIATEEGRAEGLAEGLVEGRAKGRAGQELSCIAPGRPCPSRC